MSTSEILLGQIAKGKHNNATVSAALDALQEDTGITLLAAVIEVANVVRAAAEASAIARAAALLRPSSALRSALIELIVTECPGADEDADAMVSIVAGCLWPHRLVRPGPSGPWLGPIQSIGVGAAWVLERAALIRRNRARARAIARAARPF